jgi:hypothetical protein
MSCAPVNPAVGKNSILENELLTFNNTPLSNLNVVVVEVVVVYGGRVATIGGTVELQDGG